MKYAAVLFVAVVCSAAFASEPGQPLDCSDWVIVESGLSISTLIPYPCPDADGTTTYGCRNSTGNTDNTGGFFYQRDKNLGVHCGASYEPLVRHAIYRFQDGKDDLVAYLDDRCGAIPDCFDQAYGGPGGFDDKNGRLFLPLGVRINGPGPQCNMLYQTGGALCVLSGFTTTFEILQTYTPTPTQLSFHVPYMPEGMAGADHFDTFWGPLLKPLDFTQAHGLQCNYPAAAPHVGDFLSVPDTVPTPAPGVGVYFVTSATYQGATRYGRKTTGGHLTGRDPAVLPACTP